MYRAVFLLAIPFIYIGCGVTGGDDKVEQSAVDKCSVYPSVVDSMGLQKMYDSARWSVYTWHCDMPYRPKNDSSRKMTFGELELKFKGLVIKADTVEFGFYFIDRGSIVISTALTDFCSLYTSVGYARENGKKIYMLSPSGYAMSVTGSNSRYGNPLQPEVLNYIYTKMDSLTPCFKELVEALRIKK